MTREERKAELDSSRSLEELFAIYQEARLKRTGDIAAPPVGFTGQQIIQLILDLEYPTEEHRI